MEFTSSLGIGQNVKFLPMQRHCNNYLIAKDNLYGTITAVKFTKAKVFYSIVDEYWGHLFDDVDSVSVRPTKKKE